MLALWPHPRSAVLRRRQGNQARILRRVRGDGEGEQGKVRVMQAWQTYNTEQDAAEYVDVHECGYWCCRIECDRARQDAGRAEGGYDQERHNATRHASARSDDNVDVIVGGDA